MKNLKNVALLALSAAVILTACGGSSNTTETQSVAPAASEATDAGSSSDAAADDTVYTLTFGSTANEKDANYIGSLAWKEYIEKESAGRIKVELYPNGQMGNDRELAEAVQMGQLTSMATASSNMSVLVPELAVLDVPFVVTTREDVAKIFGDEEFHKVDKNTNYLRSFDSASLRSG